MRVRTARRSDGCRRRGHGRWPGLLRGATAQQLVDRACRFQGDLGSGSQCGQQFPGTLLVPGPQPASQVGDERQLLPTSDLRGLAELSVDRGQVGERDLRSLGYDVGARHLGCGGKAAGQVGQRASTLRVVRDPVRLGDDRVVQTGGLLDRHDRHERDAEGSGPARLGVAGHGVPILIGEHRHEDVAGLDVVEQCVPPTLATGQVVVVVGQVAQGPDVGYEGVDDRPVGPGIADEDLHPRSTSSPRCPSKVGQTPLGPPQCGYLRAARLNPLSSRG